MSWIETVDEGHSLRFSTLGDQGWSAPQTIATGDDWFVNWADVPSIASSSDGSLAAHWLERMGDGAYAYGVRISLSRDGGAHWSDPVWLHADRNPTEHGFATLVPVAPRRFTAVWLDGNALSSRREMELRSVTFDDRGVFEEEVVIDSRVCECCTTAAAATKAGAVLVAYRDRSADDIRDIFVSRGRGDSWSAPKTCHDDRWKIPG